MDHDEKPLPTNTHRRRSLFDDESEAKEHDRSFKDFPEETCDIIYPKEYVEKVTSEIEQWKMHIEKALKEFHKSRSETMELKNTVVNENVLTVDQYEVTNLLDIEGYMRRMKKFCDRVTIFSNITQYKPDTETEYYSIAAQKKIEKEILKYVKQKTERN